MNTSENFTIGTYKVRPSTRTIKIDDEIVHLQPKVMALLCYLAKHANKVISRDELVAQVWKGTIVSDDAIHRTISILRSVFKDNPKNPQYLETITKTGYRIIAPVKFDQSVMDYISQNRINKKLIIVFVTVSIILISMVLYLIPDEIKTLVKVPKISYLTSHNGLEYAPHASPINYDILYNQYNQGWEGNYVIESKIGSNPKKLNIENHFIDSIWAPDGKAIYSHENNAESCHIVKHYISGLPSQSVADCITNKTGMFFYMDVSIDNKYIMTSERGANIPRQLYLNNLDTGERKRFFDSVDGIGDYMPKFSLDNKWVAFTRGFTANSREILIVPINGGKSIQLTNDDAFIQDLAWTSKNNLVFISNRETGINSLWHVKIDGSEPTWLNLAIDGINRIDVAFDDSFLAYQTWYQPFNVYQIGLNQLDSKLDNIMDLGKSLTFTKKENISPTLSPDGKYLAYISNKTGSYSLWVSEVDKENGHQMLVNNVIKFAAPEWSADSKQISFTKLNNDKGDICITNIQGQYSCITDSPEDELFSSWSNDQNLVYFTKISEDGKKYMSYQYNLKSQTLKPTEFESGMNIKESKYIENIVYYNEAVTSNIYLYNKKTKEKRLLVSDFFDIYYKSWDVTMDGIYYFSINKTINFYDFESQTTKPIISMKKVGGYDTTNGLQVDEDSQSIILSLSPMTLNGDIGLVENFAELIPNN